MQLKSTECMTFLYTMALEYIYELVDLLSDSDINKFVLLFHERNAIKL